LRLKTWIAACSLMITLVVPGVASAAIISIGTLHWESSLEFGPWPDPSGVGFNILPLVGTDGRVTNASPVSFLNLALRTDWGYLGTHAFNTCFAPTLNPGAAFECGTGPVMLAPALPNGIFYSASVSGSLGAASFLLPDGRTFVANSTTFATSTSWTFGAPNSPLDVDILVEGTVVEGTLSVPEPSSLALLAGGLLCVYRARRRSPDPA
jgi:PEP-CTERM motif